MIYKTLFSGVSNIGIQAIATDKYGIFPIDLEKDTIEKFEEILNIPILQTKIANSSLMGSLCVGNSNGLILPEITLKDEFSKIENFIQENNLDINVNILKSNNTAFGNLILANDYGGIISKEISNLKKDVEKILKVKVGVGNFCELPTVGSNGIATNKGCVLNPLTTDVELEWVRGILNIEVIGKSTVNKGAMQVGSGIIANSNGALVGVETTGPEILRIEEYLDLID
ncbi:translation initiation factor IF-6 [Methanococcus voltae]|jgi:translation initiation factor 6|uniref:Translation initiation factor 6 n=1 Tax=Methanococcus voltae (strain ATCC BAA-1334 / A3) TaxID=456320 RepID=D7DV67_METV3|nr:translation initiation factor IF-6 [Methanococcus voltae]MCS3901930.1 translation initiation factor 6 [Methanococcus voltae]